MVVRFDFEGEIPQVVKADNPGVIDKRGIHPRFRDTFCRSADVGSKQAVYFLLACWCGVLDVRLESLVNTMLTPRLSHHLQFLVGGISIFGLILAANGL